MELGKLSKLKSGETFDWVQSGNEPPGTPSCEQSQVSEGANDKSVVLKDKTYIQEENILTKQSPIVSE